MKRALLLLSLFGLFGLSLPSSSTGFSLSSKSPLRADSTAATDYSVPATSNASKAYSSNIPDAWYDASSNYGSYYRKGLALTKSGSTDVTGTLHLSESGARLSLSGSSSSLNVYLTNQGYSGSYPSIEIIPKALYGTWSDDDTELTVAYNASSSSVEVTMVQASEASLVGSYDSTVDLSGSEAVSGTGYGGVDLISADGQTNYLKEDNVFLTLDSSSQATFSFYLDVGFANWFGTPSLNWDIALAGDSKASHMKVTQSSGSTSATLVDSDFSSLDLVSDSGTDRHYNATSYYSNSNYSYANLTSVDTSALTVGKNADYRLPLVTLTLSGEGRTRITLSGIGDGQSGGISLGDVTLDVFTLSSSSTVSTAQTIQNASTYASIYSDVTLKDGFFPPRPE